MSDRISFPRQILRAGRLICLAGWIALGLSILALAFPLLGQHRRGRVAGAWSRGLLRVLGVRLHVSGSVPNGRALVVANHVSWIDPFLILASVPVRFVAKDEVRRWPVFGWLAAQAGTVFIQRERQRDVTRVTQVFADRLNDGERVAVFPEATTGDGSYLRPFKTALFEVAVRQNAYCVPTGLRYAHRAAAWIDDMGFAESIWQIVALPRLDAELVFCPPIPAYGHTRRMLATASEHAIATALSLAVRHNRSETPGDPPA